MPQGSSLPACLRSLSCMSSAEQRLRLAFSISKNPPPIGPAALCTTGQSASRRRSSSPHQHHGHDPGRRINIAIPRRWNC